MQTIASVSRSVWRLTFRRGSPQRIQYSPRLAVGALLLLVLLAVASQIAVFRADLIGVCLYLFTLAAGLYLGTALLSRKVPPARLRVALQAVALVLAAAHALILVSAPFSSLMPALPYAVAVIAAGLATLALVNTLQFALARQRAAALSVTLGFVFAVAAFYATMHLLLGIAMA